LNIPHHNIYISLTEFIMAAGGCIKCLTGFIWVFAFYWMFWFGMRAEMRYKKTLNFTGVDGTDPPTTRHEANSLWMRIDCHDWDDDFTGSKQPVACVGMYFFDTVGMKLAIIGWIMCLVSSSAVLCCITNDKKKEKKALAIVVGGGLMMLIGWILVLTDDSHMPERAWSWWFGMLCGPLYMVFAAFRVVTSPSRVITEPVALDVAVPEQPVPGV
jgi:hypothetical protein